MGLGEAFPSRWISKIIVRVSFSLWFLGTMGMTVLGKLRNAYSCSCKKSAFAVTFPPLSWIRLLFYRAEARHGGDRREVHQGRIVEDEPRRIVPPQDQAVGSGEAVEMVCRVEVRAVLSESRTLRHLVGRDRQRHRVL